MKIMKFLNDDSVKESKCYNEALLEKVISIWNCFKIEDNASDEHDQSDYIQLRTLKVIVFAISNIYSPDM